MRYWIKVHASDSTCIARSEKNTLQNISTFHIELLLVKIIILNSINWRLWIEVPPWTCFFQLLTNICIYMSQIKMTWKLPIRYIIYTHIYIVVCIALNKLYLVVCTHRLCRKLIIEWQSEHLRISSLYLMHELQHCNGNPFDAYYCYYYYVPAQYDCFCVNADTDIRMWRMYLCLGNWNCTHH